MIVSEEFNFETKTASMIFTEMKVLDLTEIAAYWEEATDGEVQKIEICCGMFQVELTRDSSGSWSKTGMLQ